MIDYKRSNFLIILWIIISIWGMINIYSATYTDLIAHDLWIGKIFATQALLFFFLFIILLFLIKLKKKAYDLIYILTDVLFYFSLFSLIIVLVPSIGAIRGGARSVIDLGIIDYQPLELYKITVILFLAKNFSQIHAVKDTYTKSIGVAASGLIFLYMQPELGGIIIVLGVIYIMVLINGKHLLRVLKYSVVIAFVGIVVISPKVGILKEYQYNRISNWIDPFRDAQNASRQTVYALIGISNGDVHGQGFLQSKQKSYLDGAQSSDYIFIVIAEEWGLVGVFITMGLLLSIATLSIIIGSRAFNRFGLLYCYGFGFLILFQTFINIGGVTNLIPMSGVTLPFISNGLNSYAFLSLGLFIVIVIERESERRKRKLNEQSNSLFL